MASWQELLFGSVSPVGSASDVSMINQKGYDDFMKQLNSAMGGFQSSLGQYTGQAGQGYQAVSDMASNYNNFVNKILGQSGSLAGASGNFAPDVSMNQWLSQQPGLAQTANQNVSQALSDVYSTGRAQAQAAGDQARRQAAGDLAAAGLLNTGAGVGAMTQATAQPIMEMETNLANMRSQALQNQLAQLQGQSAGLLGQGYGNAANLYGQLNQLGLSGIGGQTGALEAGAAGQGNLASLYGNLTGTGLGIGASMNQPEYWQPSYYKTGGLTDLMTSAGTLAGGIGSLFTGGLNLGNLFGGRGSNSQWQQLMNQPNYFYSM